MPISVNHRNIPKQQPRPPSNRFIQGFIEGQRQLRMLQNQIEADHLALLHSPIHETARNAIEESRNYLVNTRRRGNGPLLGCLAVTGMLTVATTFIAHKVTNLSQVASLACYTLAIGEGLFTLCLMQRFRMKKRNTQELERSIEENERVQQQITERIAQFENQRRTFNLLEEENNHLLQTLR